MRRLLIAIALLAWPLPAGAEDLLPRPSALEPQVRFWTRVYTEVGTDGGFVHDSRNLDVVYEVLRFPENLSRRGRDRRVRAAKRRYAAILRKLAAGKRKGLGERETRVLALWPEGVSNATLRAAAKRLRFQLGQANKMREGLIRAGAWQAYVEQSLASEGVPTELAALPHVESSYNALATSHAGAAGMWQFTRGTGRLFMRVDHVVDERLDSFVATRAAALLLRKNHERLLAWPLAITAYNHGTGGMERAVRILGTRDIAQVVKRYKSRSFGFASRNFYTSFLAALDVSQSSERYFGPLVLDQPVEYEVVVLDHFYSVSTLRRAFGVDLETLRSHNLSLRPAVWSGKKLVPRGFVLRIARAAEPAPTQVALANIPASEKRSKQIRDRFHKVRRGDTLSRIARRYGVRESELVALNGLRSRHRIRAGQVLRLPIARGAAAKVRSLAPAPVVEAAPVLARADGVYVVKRGDTLSSIARRTGMPTSELVALNDLENRHRIRAGQTLKLSGPAAGPATYRVRRGDTLSSIARRFGVSISRIASANGIRNRHRLRVGQVLRIPSA